LRISGCFLGHSASLVEQERALASSADSLIRKSGVGYASLRGVSGEEAGK